MWSIVYVGLFVGLLLFIGLETRNLNKNEHDELIQPLHFMVILYLSVNILICLWEMALFLHIRDIESTFQGYKKKLENGQLPNPLFLFKHVPFWDAIGSKHWHDVWATYSLLDISYSQEGSFGYNADVGNGFTTIIPSIIFLIGSSNPNLIFGASARQLGFFSALFLYQALYGTIIYFFQFVANARWRDHGVSKLTNTLLVGGTNGFWIIGPLLGLYSCYRMVIDDSVNVFFE